MNNDEKNKFVKKNIELFCKILQWSMEERGFMKILIWFWGQSFLTNDKIKIFEKI